MTCHFKLKIIVSNLYANEQDLLLSSIEFPDRFREQSAGDGLASSDFTSLPTSSLSIEKVANSIICQIASLNTSWRFQIGSS